MVYYTSDLDGGGNTFGRAYVPFVERHIGRRETILEWCSGPGFIGFSLLAAGLCKFLDLADLNDSASAVIEATARDARIEHLVRFHASDCLDGIPLARQSDLIVGNPPHVNAVLPVTAYEHSHNPLIWRDEDWSIHRRFYATAAQHLRPGGSVLIQENHRFSSPGDFEQMIREARLENVGVFECGAGYEDYYFIWAGLPQGSK